MGDERVGLVGFTSRTGEILQAEGLNVISHIHANPEDKRGSVPAQEGRINFHDWKQYRTGTRPAPSEAQPYKHLLRGICFNDFIRCTDRWDWSRELVNDWSGYEHLFSLAFDDAWAWLVDNWLTTVVYSNVPHQGIAVVQFHLAQLIGIKTRIFMQSPFAGRSWLTDHWNDLGRFKTSSPGEPFDIDTSPPAQQPFYMKSVRSDLSRKARVVAHQFRARVIVGLGLTGLNRESRRRSYQRNMKRWQRAIDNDYYLRSLTDVFCDVPKDEPYVYFPLHLQPEMTTDILGGIYADQVSALEELREMVPPEVAIYVKENPKQTGRMRGIPFFERIQRISNISLLSRNFSSFDLIRDSLAVATISGTAGWEALRMGKPAIAFGHTFWSGLPGAFYYDAGADWRWQDVMDFEYERDKFEDAVRDMSRHAHPGVCDPVYSVLAEDFDADENARTLCKTLLEQGRL